MIRPLNYVLGVILKNIFTLVLKLSPKLQRKINFLINRIIEATHGKDNPPQYLFRSLIAIEDKRHFQHQGVDFYSIARALINNTTTNRLEGASTITQQLIRCITNERSINLKRKIKEIILALLISEIISKQQILTAYLHLYKFNTFIGIADFCKIEGYDLTDLSENQSAQIAARFKYPSINSYNYIKYLKRVRTIEIYCTNTKYFQPFILFENKYRARKILKFT